jgi:hypothetical protein
LLTVTAGTVCLWRPGCLVEQQCVTMQRLLSIW